MKSGTIAIVLGLAMILASIILADVPGVINYQGRLTDPNGAPVADSSTNNLTFSIYDSTNAVTPLWAEAHPNVPVMNGLFSVLLGSVTNPLSPSLFSTNAGITRWLEVNVNGETLTPRKELVSVAYALKAWDAATLAGLSASQFAASSLTNEIIALQSSTNFLLSQTIILQGATNVLQAQAADLQAATGALNIAVGDLNAATGALQIAVGDLQTATNALQIQVGDLQAATNALSLATNALQAQLGVLATSAVTQAQDPMIISNGTVFLDYDTNDFVLRGQIGVKNADMVDGMHASNIIEAASNAVTPPIVALQGAANTLNLATNALNTQVRDLQGATNALNTATNALQVQAADLQAATGVLNTAVGNLNTATGALNIAVGDLQTATNALTIQVGTLQGATNALNSATNALQAQLSVLATSAITNAQDPMIISNGVIYWHYDTNDFVLRGQAGIQDKWVNIIGDIMTGDLTMSNYTRIWGTNIIDSLAITNNTITNADIAANADIDGNKIKYATTDTTGTVRFATDGQNAANLAVQANDSRLRRVVADNLTNNAVPRWDGTSLTNGSIHNLANGNVGIGTTNPATKLDVNGSANIGGSLSVTGRLDMNTNQIIGVTNISFASDRINIGSAAIGGSASVAIGDNISAGGSCVAIGKSAIASVQNAVAIGASASAGTRGIAIGKSALHEDVNGIAIGYNAYAHNGSIGIGYRVNAYEESLAVGAFTKAQTYGVALGGSSLATNYGIAVGYTVNGSMNGVGVGHQANGANSGVAIGYNASAPNNNVAIGSYVNNTEPNSTMIKGALNMNGSPITNATYIRNDDVAPLHYFRETDQTLPAGMWRLGFDGNSMLIDENTAAAGGFSTYSRHLVIKSGGDVGIGTTSPGAKLEVAGQIKITGGAPGAGKVLTSDSAGLGTWQPITIAGPETDPQVADYMAQFSVPRWRGINLTGGSIYNLDNGNVGIGIISPSYALHLNTDRTLRLEGPSAANDNYGFSLGGNGFFGIDAPGIPNGRFVVKNSGNVGVGTPNPAAKLDVQGKVSIRGSIGTSLETSTYLGKEHVDIGPIFQNLGLLTVYGNAQINGDISATGTKYMRIIHPVNTNKFLYHASIESPLAELLYRGKTQLSNGVAYVNLNTHYGLIPQTLDPILTNLTVCVYNNASWTRVRCPLVSGVSFSIEAETTNCNDIVEWIAVGKRIGINVSDKIEVDNLNEEGK